MCNNHNKMLNPNAATFYPRKLNPDATPFLSSVPCVSLNPECEYFCTLDVASEINDINHLPSKSASYASELLRFEHLLNPPLCVPEAPIGHSLQLNAAAPLFPPAYYHPAPCRIDNMLENVVESGTYDQQSQDHNSSIVSLNDSNCDSAVASLVNLRMKNPDRIIIAHLNINSIRNKFEMVSELIIGNVDIMPNF